jgi:ribosomal-protein-alanine N-acetyltransferase
MPIKHHGPSGAEASSAKLNPSFLRDTAKSRLYRLRTATGSDIDQLTELEREVFSTLWPPTNFDREVKKTTQAVLVVSVNSGTPSHAPTEQTGSLVERVVGGIKTLATSGTGSETVSDAGGQRNGDRIAGWAIVWFGVGEAHIASIGVSGSDRRRGVGELLVLGTIDAATNNDCDELTLEVRKSNEAAQALYRKYGFRVVGERKAYYVDDNEDALIMTTPDIREPKYSARLADLAADHAHRWAESGSRFERV